MSSPEGAARIADVPAALVASVDRDDRRALVAGSAPSLPTGIDFVEVVPTALLQAVLHLPTAPSWRMLLVHLLRGPVPADWDAARVAIVGGVRADPALNPVDVAWAHPALGITGTPPAPPPPLPPGVTPAEREVVQAAVPVERRDRVLVVRTTTRGDLSGYLLRVVAADGASLPPDLDAPLAQDRFAFSVECPSALDCVADAVVPAPGPSPLLDYLARDYPALRRRLLDRMAALIPGWTDTAAADVGVTLLELMAYLGDDYAYRQDAAAVEAYLTTARQRTSVRRHARLLGYPLGDGCSARGWLALSAEAEVDLPRGSAVADGGRVPAPPGGRAPSAAVDAGAIVFETTRAVRLLPARNAIPLHGWGDAAHALPAGATAAFLAVPPGPDPELRAGDVLVLAELPPGGGDPRLGDPLHRQAVRLARDPIVVPDARAPGVTVLEFRWVAEDALDHPLVVTERGPDGLPVARAVALANVVLADAGATIADEELDQVPDGGAYDAAPRPPYRPRLDRPGVAFVDPVDPLAGPAGGASSARAAATTVPGRARASVGLDDGRRGWRVRRDLLGSARLDAHFVVETDDAGVAWLRFGSGVHGRRPAALTRFHASYRLGSGAAGNVAPNALVEPLLLPDGTAPFAGVTAWNPLAATGGHDPEDPRAVQQVAPQAFRSQKRAVTADDHARVAEAVGGVQRAVARRRWTGSWPTVEVTVDAVAARAGDPAVRDAVLAALETRRLAGVDVEVTRTLWVPLFLALAGCVLPGHRAPDVAARVLAELWTGVLPDGRRGLFHPDRLTFGQPVLLADVVAAAMGVPGVAWVDVIGFRRLDAPDADTAANLAAGQVTLAPREVARCDSDPSLPEFGRVEVDLGGGS